MDTNPQTAPFSFDPAHAGLIAAALDHALDDPAFVLAHVDELEALQLIRLQCAIRRAQCARHALEVDHAVEAAVDRITARSFIGGAR